MSWGLVAVAGATVVGGVLGSKASKSASSSQADAARQSSDAQERMFQQALDIQEPYREAGYSALSGLQDLTDPRSRAKQLGQFYGSQEYASMAEQAENATLRSEAAQGGLRSGSSYASLQNIAPQLGQNFLSNQYNQLTGIANLGMGAASQGAASANQLGTAQGQNLMMAGNAAAQNQLNQAGIWSDTLGSLAGLGYGYSKGYI